MTRLLALALERETDIVRVRKQTRRLAELLGFGSQDQTRITTAVSEIARNAYDYAGGGRAEFRLLGEAPPQTMEIAIIDSGPGIAHLEAILDGAHRSATGLGVGLLGARRLMDSFAVETATGTGTTVRIGKKLPAGVPPVRPADLSRIVGALAAEDPVDPIEELREQNHAMLVGLQELQDRQSDLERLNLELQDTNRGVVALYAELDERADHLRRADELKSRFLSNMSHEFRTPLNSILALSRLLLAGEGGLAEEQRRQVEFIRKSAQSLTDLVDDLLDIAKVEAGKTVVAAAEFTVESLFGALRGMLRPLLVGSAVTLVFEDAGDVPPLVTDEGKLSQILRNFISNAIKFTEHGEVRVWAEADPRDDTVTFSVRDTGIGIAEQDLEIIFQEFSQIAHPMQARVKGTGLGLPLAKKLAELLGGRTEVESAPGLGSVFRVRLPRVYPLAAVPAESEVDWRPDPDRVAVLALEDDAADAFVLERSLAGSRYQILPARSVSEAKRALAHLRPSVIIVDPMLQGEEAWRFVMELRQQQATADTPILVISSSGEERKALNLGADEYMAKPVDPPRLLALLDRLTGHRSIVRVLLVDDEEVARYLVKQLLPRGAFAVTEAATAFDALGRLREERPDVVLLDLAMPGMSGYELLQRIGADPDLSGLPVIVVTSAVLGPEDRGRLARAARILSKAELTSDSLMAAIREAIGTPEETPA